MQVALCERLLSTLSVCAFQTQVVQHELKLFGAAHIHSEDLGTKVKHNIEDSGQRRLSLVGLLQLGEQREVFLLGASRGQQKEAVLKELLAVLLEDVLVWAEAFLQSQDFRRFVLKNTIHFY